MGLSDHISRMTVVVERTVWGQFDHVWSACMRVTIRTFALFFPYGACFAFLTLFCPSEQGSFNEMEIRSAPLRLLFHLVCSQLCI